MSKQNETKTTETVDLTTLATEINQSHQDCLGTSRTTLSHAVKTGDLLRQAKKALKRGEWKPWVQENCQFSLREAQRYMKVAKEISKVRDEGVDTSEMTLTEVLGHLKNLSLNATSTDEIAETVDPELCFRISEAERDQRVKRYSMSPPTLPETAAEATAKVIDKLVIQVRRAIRTGVIKQVQPQIKDDSLEPADVAIVLFEKLREKLTAAMIFDEPEKEAASPESNGHHTLSASSKPEVREQEAAKVAI